ncbi:transposable element Tcb2 transposase [Trichonephila clavipes]|nr:transposable element Tcb2 transposase [Trichonephila clavipes]
MSNNQRLDDEMRRITDTGSIERKPGQGRPRAMMARNDHHLSIIARRTEGLQLLSYLFTWTHYLPPDVLEIDNYGGGGLMVWAGIMLDGRTPLHVFERDSVTGVRYRDEVLETYVQLFRGACGQEFILMDDNTRLQRTPLVDEFLESEDICRMD